MALAREWPSVPSPVSETHVCFYAATGWLFVWSRLNWPSSKKLRRRESLAIWFNPTMSWEAGPQASAGGSSGDPARMSVAPPAQDSVSTERALVSTG